MSIMQSLYHIIFHRHCCRCHHHHGNWGKKEARKAKYQNYVFVWSIQGLIHTHIHHTTTIYPFRHSFLCQVS